VVQGRCLFGDFRWIPEGQLQDTGPDQSFPGSKSGHLHGREAFDERAVPEEMVASPKCGGAIVLGSAGQARKL
jgi:hypothetical protein